MREGLRRQQLSRYRLRLLTRLSDDIYGRQVARAALFAVLDQVRERGELVDALLVPADQVADIVAGVAIVASSRPPLNPSLIASGSETFIVAMGPSDVMA